MCLFIFTEIDDECLPAKVGSGVDKLEMKLLNNHKCQNVTVHLTASIYYPMAGGLQLWLV